MRLIYCYLLIFYLKLYSIMFCEDFSVGKEPEKGWGASNRNMLAYVFVSGQMDL